MLEGLFARLWMWMHTHTVGGSEGHSGEGHGGDTAESTAGDRCPAGMQTHTHGPRSLSSGLAALPPPLLNKGGGAVQNLNKHLAEMMHTNPAGHTRQGNGEGLRGRVGPNALNAGSARLSSPDPSRFPPEGSGHGGANAPRGKVVHRSDSGGRRDVQQE